MQKKYDKVRNKTAYEKTSKGKKKRAKKKIEIDFQKKSRFGGIRNQQPLLQK